MLSLSLVSGFAEEFPKMGYSYSLRYDKPSGSDQWWPNEVKILKGGIGEWFLVEFSHNGPEGKKITERMWLNFAKILAAVEQ
jgi:hypothetical protein